MHDDFERAKGIFSTVDTRPSELSTVDVVKAIETGKRRKRFRRLSIGGAAVGLSVVAAIALPFALR